MMSDQEHEGLINKKLPSAQVYRLIYMFLKIYPGRFHQYNYLFVQIAIFSRHYHLVSHNLLKNFSELYSS